MYQFNPYAIPPLIASIYMFSFGLFIFLKQRQVWRNFICSLSYFCCAIWLFGYFMLYSSRHPNSLFWPKFVYSGVIFIAPTFYHFTCVLLGLQTQRQLIPLVYLIGCLFLAFVWITNSFIVGLNKFFWGYHTKVNPLYHSFFLSLFFVIYCLGLLNLHREYKNKKTQTGKPLELTRIKYFLFTYTLASFGSIDFLPDRGIQFYPFGGYVFVSIAIAITAYAMVRHRLMDINIVITRTGIFMAVYTLLLATFFVIAGWSKNWFMIILGDNWWIGALGVMAILATAGPFFYIYLQKRAETLLLREQLRYQEILKQAAREMASIRNLKKLLNLIVHTVTKTVRISYSGLYLFHEKSNLFMLEAERNLKKIQPDRINRDNPLIVWFEKHNEPLVYEEIIRQTQEKSIPLLNEITEQMRLLNATVVIPGFLKDNLIGFLILGDKRSGKIYTSADLNTFSLLLNQAALAIENASIYQNIEEQVRQRTKELVQTQKQLIQAEKLATVGTLAGGVAHEINNPLTAILTNVQMLLGTDNTIDADSKESLQLIEEATRRCRTIVQKLMAFAKKPLEPTEVIKISLLDVVNNVVTLLDYQLKQENIKIITEIEGEDFYIIGNQNELEQVLTNLVLNAKDAIKNIKKSGGIHIAISKTDDWIKLEIRDEGCGIPKEIIPKIFDPFFTTKEVGKGTGLGLSICQSIVEKHNGIISVKSEVNKGSVFTVRLPKAKEISRINSRV